MKFTILNTHTGCVSEMYQYVLFVFMPNPILTSDIEFSVVVQDDHRLVSGNLRTSTLKGTDR